ncbi:Niemann-Pick type C-related protein 1 [Candida viswanathii]|uniref:Niemann-Pick type C-related protein 1 n=1 Tax=Candida viswanathii TaxID=5486 RepID=A0A367YFX5_9ASCO|nr:Niemann-Pick type C-related protein 1 [Candida viswanathii]
MQVIQLLLLIAHFTIALATSSSEHKAGYCNTYGNCGKKSVFGQPLPCVTFEPAVKASQESRDRLKAICGEDFEYICCSPEQIDSLELNLKRVDPLISSCPACRKNFYDFFCQFSCSPNESQFVEILKTEIAKDTGEEIVTEINQYVEPDRAKKFYDSCKNVKFLATNGYAMDLIGGGAKNYLQFLKFLGDEKPLLGGSPYQINFKYELPEDDSGLVLRNEDVKACDDAEYRCACTDCEASCPTLPHARDLNKKCTVGVLPCFSFSIIIIWSCLILMLGGYHVYLAKLKRERGRRISIGAQDDDDDMDTMMDLGRYVEFTKRGAKAFLERLAGNIQDAFESIGYFCAHFPGISVGGSLAVAVLLSLGLFNLRLETDPVKLWVSPQDQAYKNQQYFDANFGEWFRIEQVIVSSKTEKPVLNWDVFKWWFEKESQLEDLNKNVTLSDICFKPLGDTCAIQSFTQYFQGDITGLNENTWKTKLQNCVDAPVNCLPTFQQPLKPNILFDNNDISKAKAFSVTILVNSDSKDGNYTGDAISYEQLFLKWAAELEACFPEDLNVAYSAEISLKEELNQSSNTDIRTIAISYILMFIYASLALGGKLPHANLYSLVKTRFTLGFAGIIIILLSVTASVGFFSLIGLRSTLIIAEVIPFLVLAIGIDNIFLIVHELHVITEVQSDKEIDFRIAQSLKNIGPSCFISAILQVSMFLLATSVGMPAVRNFAFYGAGAVLINFLLQMTCFIGLLSLDQRRLEENRVDCVPCITVSPITLGNDGEGTPDTHLEYNFSNWIAKHYAPFLLKRTTKPKVITFFVLWVGISLSLFPEIKLGLDQRIAIPSSSYLVNYFNSVYDYLNVGPPVFFVVKDLDVTERPNQQKLCGRFSTCDEYSLANILEQEVKRTKVSMLAEPASNWLDDFFSWLNPDLDQCCRFKKSSVFEGQQPEFCLPNAPQRQCQACYLDHQPPYDASMDGFPENEDFMFYFNDWIEEPSDPCPLGGKASHGQAVSRTPKQINSSYFRTSFVPLRGQHEFINAHQSGHNILKEIKKFLPSVDMFVFSPFFIFFTQYQDIVLLTILLVSVAMVIILFVSTVLLSSFRAAGILTLTIITIMINIGGVMALWSISLNAVSLVNLIICVGFAVEFTIHLTRAYCVSDVKMFDSTLDQEVYNNLIHIEPENVRRSSITSINANFRNSKAYNALCKVGGSLISGVTLTKIIGITVLAFTRSQIFEVYYFRMWLSLVVISFVHAFVLLPVLLSL